MKIVIFSGTTEGRELSEYLSEHQTMHDVCVATKSGENVMTASEYAHVHVGRMDGEQMELFFEEKKPDIVVDATHPYAQIVTEELSKVCLKTGIHYIRIKRTALCEGEVRRYENAPECARALTHTEGNILLTTGSKELACYTEDKTLRDRIYVRVLPTTEAMELCQKAGIDERHIIAMYGPHTLSMNQAVLEQFQIRHMVTKSSGKNGGFEEKIQAAADAGVTTHLIDRPQSETEENKNAMTLEQCKHMLISDSGCDHGPVVQIALVGIGMGDAGSLTLAGKEAMDKADVIYGANRMLKAYHGSAKCMPYYLAEDIMQDLAQRLENVSADTFSAAVLFSGDTGIYSGAGKLYQSLKAWNVCTQLSLLPGISSFSAFAALIGASYTGARLESLHGKSMDVANQDRIEKLLTETAMGGDEVWLLMSGKSDFDILKHVLKKAESKCDMNLIRQMKTDCGYNISYPDQSLLKGSFEDVYAQIQNGPDGLFIVRLYME